MLQSITLIKIRVPQLQKHRFTVLEFILSNIHQEMTQELNVNRLTLGNATTLMQVPSFQDSYTNVKPAFIKNKPLPLQK